MNGGMTWGEAAADPLKGSPKASQSMCAASDSTRRLLITLGALGTAAGIAVTSYYVYRRTRRRAPSHTPNVNELLGECYAKVKEIQRTLADLPGPAAA